jgi:hypothetical protein
MVTVDPAPTVITQIGCITVISASGIAERDFAGYAAVRNFEDQPILGPGESNPHLNPLPQGESKGTRANALS